MSTEFISDLVQNRLARYLFLDTLDDARQLLRRFHEVNDFRSYIEERAALVMLCLFVVFLISIGCVMGVITLLPDMHWLFILPLLAAAAMIFGGSLFVLVYVYFSWIEGRSMERAISARHKARRGPVASWLRNRLHVDIGPMPPVPWLPSILFLVLPLSLLFWAWPGAALAIIVFGAATPVTYAWLDR